MHRFLMTVSRLLFPPLIVLQKTSNNDSPLTYNKNEHNINDVEHVLW